MGVRRAHRVILCAVHFHFIQVRNGWQRKFAVLLSVFNLVACAGLRVGLRAAIHNFRPGPSGLTAARNCIPGTYGQVSMLCVRGYANVRATRGREQVENRNHEARENSAIRKRTVFAAGNMTAGLCCAVPIEQASNCGQPSSHLR